MSFGDPVDFNTSQAVLGQLCMGKGIFVTQSLHSEEQMDKAGIQSTLVSSGFQQGLQLWWSVFGR